jgi:hypothetical protein
MGSNLHMHVASLKVQDEINRASAERRAKQAEQATRAGAVTTVAPRRRWARLRPTYVIGR